MVYKHDTTFRSLFLAEEEYEIWETLADNIH
jgi:hypothetical protein